MLTDILAKYAARDGGQTGTDKNTDHTYGPLYESLFEPKRATATHVLEIGVFGGGSIAAWADYFTSATVTGLDVDLSRLRWPIAHHPRVALHRADATCPATAARLFGPAAPLFDIIIDDGSHLPAHQRASLAIFGPYIKPGGLYVIEDIDARHGESHKKALEQTGALVGLAMDWHDLRTPAYARVDDIVAVFKKRA